MEFDTRPGMAYNLPPGTTRQKFVPVYITLRSFANFAPNWKILQFVHMQENNIFWTV